MIRGLYTAAAGALVAQASVDAVANNLANSSSVGFKRALLQVQAQPSQEINRYQTDPGQSPINRLAGVQTNVLVGPLGTGSQVYDTPQIFEQGTLAQTGNQLDFAVYGDGFFATRDAQSNVRYTRDGAFVRNANNLLVTDSGDAVLDAKGQVIVLPPNGNISASADGTLYIESVLFAQLGVFSFANPAALRMQGANRFLDAGDAGVRPDTSSAVVQAAQEKSNADTVQSMVDLITNERWFDANEKVIQTEDDAAGQAIATVGRTTSQ